MARPALVSQPWALPLLAMDCSGPVASVALLDRSNQCFASTSRAGQSQASDLLQMSQTLLQTAALDWPDVAGLVLSHGPGSFTGLRIAAGLIQGLARSRRLHVACVSGFESMALAHRRSQDPGQPGSNDLRVLFDARLGECFEGRVRFDGHGLPRLQEVPQLVAAAGDSFAGPQLIDPQPEAFGPAFAQVPASASLAGWALRLAFDEWQAQGQSCRAAEPILAQPLYVREKVAQTTAERQQGEALGLEPMAVEDLASVLVIENQAYPFPWTSGNFQDALAVGYHGLKLVDQGVMVGYLIWMQVVDEAHLLNFTIAAPRQRRGLGQFMLDRWRGLLRPLGIQRILLEVRPTNLAAIRLYRRNGFGEIGRRKDYYPAGGQAREDAIVMAQYLLPTR